MELETLEKLISNKYGLTFTAITDDSNPSLVGLTLKTGQAPFIVLDPTTNPVHVDARCFSFAAAIQDFPGFGAAFFHHDDQWVGFTLTNVSDRAVENIIDYAFKAAINLGHSASQQYVVLPEQDTDNQYKAQPIPQPSHRPSPQTTRSALPKQLKDALAAYDYTLLPGERRDKNFYLQGQMLADYKDNFHNAVPLRRYFPTYHQLSPDQLRTYFTWRTKLLQGEFEPVSDSYAYLYLYELLNGIGVSSPAAGYQQLLIFKQKYASQFGDHMQVNLDRWLHDYVLYYRLKHQVANQVFAAEISADRDYHILLHPEKYSAEELIDAFSHHSTYLKHCRLYQKSTEHFTKLLKVVWQTILTLPNDQGQKYFDQHIASQKMSTNYFFANAVFYFRPQQEMAEYSVDSVRRYRFKGRQYYCFSLLAQPNERQNLNAFLHEVDRLVRHNFNLGHPLKPRWLPAAIVDAINQGIHDYQRQLQEAHQPKINIDLGDIEQIRQDAAATQESLITDEERQAVREEEQAATPPAPTPPSQSQETDSAALDADQNYFMHALLTGTPWKDYLKQHHLMASIMADQINEALFDEIGDDVIEFDENDQPVIIEDYRPDLEEIFLNKE